MRMWNVAPALLCRQHLLGEHRELHLMAWCRLHGQTLAGYTSTGLVELHHIRSRHAELVREMKRRGWRHKSPLPAGRLGRGGNVDAEANVRELARRCPECRRVQSGAE